MLEAPHLVLQRRPAAFRDRRALSARDGTEDGARPITATTSVPVAGSYWPQSTTASCRPRLRRPRSPVAMSRGVPPKRSATTSTTPSGVGAAYRACATCEA